MKHEKRALLLIGILFLLIGFLVVAFFGSSATVQFNTRATVDDPDAYEVQFDSDGGMVEVTEKTMENGVLTLRLHGLEKGRCFVDVYGPDDYIATEWLYVHGFHIITTNSFFGHSAGGWIIPVLAALYLAILLGYMILQYRRGMRESLYQYKNIRHLGWIIFFSAILLGMLPGIASNNSIDGTVSSIMTVTSYLSVFAFPVAFVVSILVSISNIRLIRKEGRSWRNLLGLFLSLLILLGTILPVALDEYLQRSTIVDVHNQNGAALYIEMLVTNVVLVTVAYLESILLSTIILSLKAARRVPNFDKDAILILGCQIKKDGTVTPLLRGRADRALEFAKMQQEAIGRAPIFVPSGGQGPDEVIAEAESIRNYLAETGVAEDQILVEDQSENTFENLRNSAKLIRSRFGEEAKIAFSTTNYHVFRAGILAEQQGIHAEGIGSKTRSYFWINAFVREFIATVYAERKKHVLVIALMILLTVAMVFLVYLSNNL